MQSDSSGSGKRSLTEKFEHYFGKSVSIKVAICLGLTISFLAALLMIALFMNVFTPGSVADAQANISANGSSSLPANSSMTGVNDTDQMANSTKDSLEAVEEGDASKRSYLSYIYNYSSLSSLLGYSGVSGATKKRHFGSRSKQLRLFSILRFQVLKKRPVTSSGFCAL